jgi:hypothetical protein
VPPLHHQVITFGLETESGRAELTAAQAQLEETRFWRPTSIRRGFAGGGFDGSQSLPKRARLAMDGVTPDGTKLRLPPRARGQGLNSVLHTTHRQNFLVPRRQHRSFQIAELLA